MVDSPRQVSNGLSHLLENYSDSDNEDDQPNDELLSMDAKVNKLFNELDESSVDYMVRGLELSMTTYWTKCIDKVTGHPYFWNMSTKEVTWEIPCDYTKYLEYISADCSHLNSNHYWSEMYMEDTNIPYYVNELTRVVSWEMPEEYRTFISEMEIEKAKRQLKRKFNEYKNDASTHSDTVISIHSSNDSIKKCRESKVEPSNALKALQTYSANDSMDPNVNEEMIESRDKDHLFANGATFASIITGGKLEEETFNAEQLEILRSENESDDISFIADKTNVTPNTDVDNKLLKRKRRIEFVAKREVKKADKVEPIINVNGDSNEKINNIPNVYSNFTKSHVEFGPANIEVISENVSTEDEDAKTKEVSDMSELLTSKLNFLCQEEISNPTTMKIQLETLIIAYKEKALNLSYIHKWLCTLNDNLDDLEKDAAPDGWKCNWDRDECKYKYVNNDTGEVLWEYPECKKLCDKSDPLVLADDDMVLSTTPPPNESEQCTFSNGNASELASWEKLGDTSVNATVTPFGSNDISAELASFYSEIGVDLDDNTSVTGKDELCQSNLETGSNSNDGSDVVSKKPKRKKERIHGNDQKMNDVANLMKKWNKAKKELEY